MVRLVLVGMIVCAVGVANGAEAWPRDGGGNYCQILDGLSDPLYQVEVDFIGGCEFEEYGKSSILEVDGDWEVAYFRGVLWGDVDMDIFLDSFLFLDSAGIDLPEYLGVAALDVGWTYRTGGPLSVQTRAMPGVYSDFQAFEADALSMPFSVAMIHAVDKNLSGILGAEIRPDFNQTVMPMVGVVWKAADSFRVDARLPESRLEYFVSPSWSTHMNFAWRNTTFDLEDDRDAITFEDLEVGVGVTLRPSDQYAFTATVGMRFEGSVEYEKLGGEDARAEAEVVKEENIRVDEATFVRVGLVGPF
jgi:hypothetical protein